MNESRWWQIRLATDLALQPCRFRCPMSIRRVTAIEVPAAILASQVVSAEVAFQTSATTESIPQQQAYREAALFPAMLRKTDHRRWHC